MGTDGAGPAAAMSQEILNFPGFQRCHFSGTLAHLGVSPADKGMRAQPEFLLNPGMMFLGEEKDAGLGKQQDPFDILQRHPTAGRLY